MYTIIHTKKHKKNYYPHVIDLFVTYGAFIMCSVFYCILCSILQDLPPTHPGNKIESLGGVGNL